MLLRGPVWRASWDSKNPPKATTAVALFNVPIRRGSTTGRPVVCAGPTRGSFRCLWIPRSTIVAAFLGTRTFRGALTVYCASLANTRDMVMASVWCALRTLDAQRVPRIRCGRHRSVCAIGGKLRVRRRVSCNVNHVQQANTSLTTSTPNARRVWT